MSNSSSAGEDEPWQKRRNTREDVIELLDFRHPFVVELEHPFIHAGADEGAGYVHWVDVAGPLLSDWLGRRGAEVCRPLRIVGTPVPRKARVYSSFHRVHTVLL